MTRDDLIDVKFPVLNDGFVSLVDVMGDDYAVVDAARISYGKGTRKVSEDRDLIRYLMRNNHSTPFEMAEVKLHIRCPMDIWRQWIRHRTANVNEYSTRYSEAIDSRQTTEPDAWRLQATTNKQGSSGFLPRHLKSGPCGEILSAKEQIFHQEAMVLYQERIEAGVAREQARKDLPLSTFTEAIWKIDLKNLLWFLRLRMDSHAQQEIRSYANIIGNQIVAPLFPMVWEAFNDYVSEAMILSRLDIFVIQSMLRDKLTAKEAISGHIVNKREQAECEAKLVRIGFITT